VRARGARARLVKYIGPQVWATRAGRAKTLAGAVDHLICIHDFETPYYARFGLPCTVCGHPAFGRFVQGDGAAFRARHALGDAPTLLLLLGSRRSELRRTGPQILAAADIVALRAPGVKLVAVAASHVAAQARDMCKGRPILVVDEATEKNDAFNAATAAIATSGTVTTEIGLQGTPVVVGYRLGWITWAIARFILLKAKFATLMNVAADDEAAPEFLQTRCTPENLAAAAFPLLTDPAKRQAQVAAQFAALEKMGRGGPPAAKIAAGAVLAEMSKVQA
jgi:lipid-A-disaccharide synthase